MHLTPRELHVAEVVLHKDFNYTQQVNDIALLKTSEYFCHIAAFNNHNKKSCFKGEQVDLFDFPPVCLPKLGQSFRRLVGTVAGELFLLFLILITGRLGPGRGGGNLHIGQSQGS